jgi:hypothetical protein
MTLEERVDALEQLVNRLIDLEVGNKQYTDADIAGCRQNITEMSESVYPAWNPNGYDYYQGERVSYDGKYYRCIQNHKSQADWTPTAAVSLWSEISDPSEEYPEWKQPQGAHDAYAKGDKVSHLEKHWVSDIDANVYEPSVYGWTEV